MAPSKRRKRPAGGRTRRVEKSASAFRTISEVADELEVPQHVLRFWETKFPQVRPLKRGGGRRYYRPEDVDLLRQIRSLLYHEGYTIKGVQRLMREGSLKERVDALEADTIDLSHLGAAERRKREIEFGDPSADLAARAADGPAGDPELHSLRAAAAAAI